MQASTGPAPEATSAVAGASTRARPDAMHFEWWQPRNSPFQRTRRRILRAAEAKSTTFNAEQLAKRDSMATLDTASVEDVVNVVHTMATVRALVEERALRLAIRNGTYVPPKISARGSHAGITEFDGHGFPLALASSLVETERLDDVLDRALRTDDASAVRGTVWRPA